MRRELLRLCWTHAVASFLLALLGGFVGAYVAMETGSLAIKNEIKAAFQDNELSVPDLQKKVLVNRFLKDRSEIWEPME